MILFIDEADAFLRNRQGDISENTRHAINSFLYRTGTPSDKLVVVLASNMPETLDPAVHDRVDEVIGFDLPSEAARQSMIYHYIVEYCTPPQSLQDKLKFAFKHPRSIYTGKKLIRMEEVNHELIEKIARESVGFSGRALNKMVVAWHDAAFALPDPVLTPEIMTRILEKFKL